jgi:hypothetical protein
MKSPSRNHRSRLVHLCAWPGCRRPVPLDMWGCRTHWFSLPKEIQDAIWQGWKVGKLSPEWITANEQAQAWIKDMPARIAAMNVGKNTPVPG